MVNTTTTTTTTTATILLLLLLLLLSFIKRPWYFIPKGNRNCEGGKNHQLGAFNRYEYKYILYVLTARCPYADCNDSCVDSNVPSMPLTILAMA